MRAKTRSFQKCTLKSPLALAGPTDFVRYCSTWMVVRSTDVLTSSLIHSLYSLGSLTLMVKRDFIFYYLLQLQRKKILGRRVKQSAGGACVGASILVKKQHGTLSQLVLLREDEHKHFTHGGFGHCCRRRYLCHLY